MLISAGRDVLGAKTQGWFEDSADADIDNPGRSSSQAIALILHPSGVKTNCDEIMPRPSNGIPFIVPDFAYALKR